MRFELDYAASKRPPTADGQKYMLQFSKSRVVNPMPYFGCGAFYENILRAQAARNSQMNYLNVSITGLRGRRDPALSELISSVDVKKSRIHLKM